MNAEREFSILLPLRVYRVSAVLFSFDFWLRLRRVASASPSFQSAGKCRAFEALRRDGNLRFSRSQFTRVRNIQAGCRPPQPSKTSLP